jgi:hypothetical protein
MTSAEISSTSPVVKERIKAIDSRSPGLSRYVGIMIRMYLITLRPDATNQGGRFDTRE